MSATKCEKIDWNADSLSIKKQLRQLNKAQLIRICKKKKVATNGSSKNSMIEGLINKTSNKTKKKSAGASKHKRAKTWKSSYSR